MVVSATRASAAVAGVLVTGVQLSNIGKVESPYLAVSACAFFVALAAVLVIIGMTVRVLGTGTVTESILRDFAPKSSDIPLNDPLLLGGCSTVDRFLDKYKSLCKEYEKADDDGNKKTAKELKNEISGLNYNLTHLLLVAKLAMVRKAFKQAIRVLFVCAAVAAMAIGVFAWATSQKPLTQLKLRFQEESNDGIFKTTFCETTEYLGTDYLHRCCISLGRIYFCL